MKIDITEEEREALIKIFEFFEYLSDIVRGYGMGE
jgi:hypothetical protein